MPSNDKTLHNSDISGTRTNVPDVKVAAPPVAVNPVAMLRRALRCLRLEVDGSIVDDIQAKAEAVIALIPREESVKRPASSDGETNG